MKTRVIVVKQKDWRAFEETLQSNGEQVGLCNSYTYGSDVEISLLSKAVVQAMVTAAEPKNKEEKQMEKIMTLEAAIESALEEYKTAIKFDNSKLAAIYAGVLESLYRSLKLREETKHVSILAEKEEL